MLRIISCITVEHSLPHLVFATVICLLGSVLTMRLFSRVRRTEGLQKYNWLFLSGFVGGSTIWTTHFVAMLGFQLPMDHAFNPALTILSLLIPIGFTTMAGLQLAAWKGHLARMKGHRFGTMRQQHARVRPVGDGDQHRCRAPLRRGEVGIVAQADRADVAAGVEQALQPFEQR